MTTASSLMIFFFCCITCRYSSFLLANLSETLSFKSAVFDSCLVSSSSLFLWSYCSLLFSFVLPLLMHPYFCFVQAIVEFLHAAVELSHHFDVLFFPHHTILVSVVYHSLWHAWTTDLRVRHPPPTGILLWEIPSISLSYFCHFSPPSGLLGNEFVCLFFCLIVQASSPLYWALKIVTWQPFILSALHSSSATESPHTETFTHSVAACSSTRIWWRHHG